jgi:hypothetical protein
LWQDTAETTPVTADGKSLARIDDKSGKGINATQSTASKRPLYKTDGSKHWLQFDGINDNLVTSSIDLSTIDEISLFSGMTYSGSGVQIFFEPTNQGWYLAKDATNYLFRSNGTVGPIIATYPVASLPSPNRFTLLGEISSDTCIGRMDGSQVTSTSSNQGAGNYDNDPVYIGSRIGTSLFMTGNIYSMILRSKVSNGSEISGTEAYIATKV